MLCELSCAKACYRELREVPQKKNENGDIVQKATKENRNEIVQKAKNVVKELSGVLSLQLPGRCG